MKRLIKCRVCRNTAGGTLRIFERADGSWQVKCECGVSGPICGPAIGAVDEAMDAWDELQSAKDLAEAQYRQGMRDAFNTDLQVGG
jgi:hypothetical protein